MKRNRTEGAVDSVGIHILLDYWGADFPADESVWRQTCCQAVQAMRATLLGFHFHSFSPQGCSGVAILAESHLAFHSWPELDYVGIDIFTCGDTDCLDKAVQVLHRHLQPSSVSVRKIVRGSEPVSAGEIPLRPTHEAL